MARAPDRLRAHHAEGSEPSCIVCRKPRRGVMTGGGRHSFGRTGNRPERTHQTYAPGGRPACDLHAREFTNMISWKTRALLDDAPQATRRLGDSATRRPGDPAIQTENLRKDAGTGRPSGMRFLRNAFWGAVSGNAARGTASGSWRSRARGSGQPRERACLQGKMASACSRRSCMSRRPMASTTSSAPSASSVRPCCTALLRSRSASLSCFRKRR